MSEECIFCGIVSGKIPSEVLYHDASTLVIRDINPLAPTHLLIVPFEHMTYLAYVSEDLESLFGHLVWVAREMAYREELMEGGYRLVVNQGPNSGQEIQHLHVHLLGGRPLGAIG